MSSFKFEDVLMIEASGCSRRAAAPAHDASPACRKTTRLPGTRAVPWIVTVASWPAKMTEGVSCTSGGGSGGGTGGDCGGGDGDGGNGGGGGPHVTVSLVSGKRL